MNHVMVDLETLDTKNTAIVVSIGAVRFDPNSGALGERFYTVLDRNEQRARGRTTSIATSNWWNAQSDSAKNVFQENFVPVEKSLSMFSTFCSTEPVAGMWGNGVGFDNVILSDLYADFNMTQPWPYWADRCFRTIKAIGNANDVKPPPFLGTAHNALDDALHQASHLQRIVLAAGIEV